MTERDSSFLTGQPEEILDQQSNSQSSSATVERVGLICVLVVVAVIAGMEAYANSKFQGAYNTLADQLAAAESQGAALTAEDIRQHVAAYYDGEPIIEENLPKNALGAKAMHLYEFKTLLRTQPLYIYYGIAGLAEGDRPEVLDITLQKIEPSPNYF